MKSIRRIQTGMVRRRLREYPSVALVGPRQSGKTVLAKSMAGEYFDLEQEGERLRLDLRWDDLIRGESLIILDEAQSWPDIFPRIRGAIDGDRKRNGRFLLLGSVSPSLMTHVSESLAGRLMIVELSPFTLSELNPKKIDSLWFKGGYPDGGILTTEAYPVWQNNYLKLLSQRDLPQWGLPTRPQATDRLFRMLAGIHGQLWNASQIGRSLGISYHTANHYVDFLEGAFLVRRLFSFSTNVKKRLVKAPKVFWRDSGLLHSLLQTLDLEDLLTKPWVGASWEGFVIEQIINSLVSMCDSFQPFFFRSSDFHEIDLLLDFGKRLWAIEVKLTTNPSPSDFGRLTKAADLVKADKRILISRTAQNVTETKNISCSLNHLLETMKSEIP